MAAFLEDITPFLGDGSNNEAGLSLKEFLDEYDQSRYECPCMTADVMVFRHTGKLKTVKSGMSLLMVKRRNHPSIGYWALPGGFCEMREELEETARRELMEETGLTNVPIELINTWGEVWRDPRSRIITAAYLALVDDSIAKPVAGDDAAKAEWFDISIETKGEAELDLKGKRIKRSLYSLCLTGPSDEICTATVSVDVNAEGILKEKHLKVIESNNIAFDHARFIVDGLLYIQERIS